MQLLLQAIGRCLGLHKLLLQLLNPLVKHPAVRVVSGLEALSLLGMVTNNIVALGQFSLLLLDVVLSLSLGLRSFRFSLLELLKMHQSLTVLALCRITVVFESLNLLLTRSSLLSEVFNMSKGN